MAKVVRDKRSNKTKGYGFVSFKSPDDFTKAIKEMNGETDNISIAITCDLFKVDMWAQDRSS